MYNFYHWQVISPMTIIFTIKRRPHRKTEQIHSNYISYFVALIYYEYIKINYIKSQICLMFRHNSNHKKFIIPFILCGILVFLNWIIKHKICNFNFHVFVANMFNKLVASVLYKLIVEQTLNNTKTNLKKMLLQKSSDLW